mmetsp:Transcript_17565/g.24570  ORF Transcript_17565/g.24570 Transcript_17565/m.24570 type:complete len:113 (+) Transcript_17565:161-499(+)
MLARCVYAWTNQIDEMLLDGFLQTCNLLDSVLLAPHSHVIRDRDKKVHQIEHLQTIAVPKSFEITEYHLELGSWTSRSMYVCSEKQEESAIKARLSRDERRLSYGGIQREDT